MTRVRPAHPLAVVAAMLAAACGACSRAQPAPWLVNETPSLPRGVYRLTSERPLPGAVVALRPPSAARRYLAGLGAPAEARLLKRVAAGPGQQVCTQGEWLTWPRGAALALATDRHGRALPRWRGCRRLTAGELLVIGDTPLSFDSRYFGPVRSPDIDGVYREVWRW